MKDKRKQAITDALFNITEVADKLGKAYKTISAQQIEYPNSNFFVHLSILGVLDILHKLETARINLRYLQKEGNNHEPQQTTPRRNKRQYPSPK